MSILRLGHARHEFENTGFSVLVILEGEMDYLWTPWRYSYITNADRAQRQGVPEALAAWPGDHGCVFCNMMAAVDYAVGHETPPEQAERAAGVVLRAAHNFVCLNRYPYTSGHLMVVPYQHQSSLSALGPKTAHELMDLGQRSERALRQIYQPDGLNLGMNLGKSAGAGVAEHVHLHVLPRWTGDTNFLTVVAETRILPEDLDTTWQRLRTAFSPDRKGEWQTGPRLHLTMAGGEGMAQNADTKIHPQGGSTPVKEDGTQEQKSAARHEPPAGVQHVEPEDPRLTGGSKPEQHRALEENVRGQGRQHPDTTAGQHATGSYTEGPTKLKEKK